MTRRPRRGNGLDIATDLSEYVASAIAPLPVALPIGFVAAALCAIFHDDPSLTVCAIVFAVGYAAGMLLQLLFVRLLFRLF